MIDTYLRTPYQTLLIAPLLPRLMKLAIPAHVYTGMALFAGLLVTPLLYLHWSLAACACLLVSGFFDTLDGSLARARKEDSPAGAVLDIVSDRIVETAVITGLYLYSPDTRGLLCLLMLGSAFLCVTSFLVVGIFINNDGYKSFHYSPGIMERTEAFFLFGGAILLPEAFTFCALAFILLVTLTALIRVRQFCLSTP